MIASELGMSVRRAQSEIDSAEFVDWLGFFEIKNNPDRGNEIPFEMVARFLSARGVGEVTKAE